MTPLNIKSGWQVSTDDRYVTCYDTKEEALKHIKFQKEQMNSKANWYITYIKINFGEHISFPSNK